MARAEEEVAEELERLGCKVNDKQLSTIAELLVTGEVVIDALAAIGEDYDGRSFPAALLITSKQVLWVPYKLSFWSGGKVSEERLYWQDVANLEFTAPACVTAKGYGTAGSVRAWFKKRSVDQRRFQEIAGKIQERVANAKAPQARPASGDQDSLVDKLERLAALREKGHISTDEFEFAKRKLLEGS